MADVFSAELAGKVIVVSGIGPGLGRAIALACADAGARVVVAARTEERVAELAEELRARGTPALGVVVVPPGVVVVPPGAVVPPALGAVVLGVVVLGAGVVAPPAAGGEGCVCCALAG